MDRQNLLESGNTRGSDDDGRSRQRSSGDASTVSQQQPVLSVRTSRIRTGSNEDRASLGGRDAAVIDELIYDERFPDTAIVVSPTSLPTTLSCSWESQSDSEERAKASSRRDRRKYVDATTPTLIDEEDEEEAEMVSLEQERLREPASSFLAKDESSLRRTPGANMYKSSIEQQRPLTHTHRRTPGASAMHRSADASVLGQEKVTDASVLGFGLTLSTPVGAARPTGGKKPFSIHSSTPSLPLANRTETDPSQISRPPRAPGSTVRTQDQRGAAFAFTPWALSKGSSLEPNRGAFSPNTLRLTEDLGNLLHEDDDLVVEPKLVSQQVFREEIGKSTQQPALVEDDNQESWTASYVFDSEDVADEECRVPRSGSGRNRRRSSGRRSRGAGRSSSAASQPGEQADNVQLLPNAQQPKPRKIQASSIGNDIGFSGIGGRGSAGTEISDGERSSPRLLNFGGAFVPPSKASGASFRRPVASAAASEPSYGASYVTPSGPEKRSIAGRSGSFNDEEATPFQNPTFRPLPPFTAHAPPDIQYQPQLTSVDHAFNPTHGLSPSPTLGFSGAGPHPFHHPAVHEFHAMGVPPQHVPIPQFPSHAWSQVLPMQYEGNWHGNPSGWAGEGYGRTHVQVADAGRSAPPSRDPETSATTEIQQVGGHAFGVLSQPDSLAVQPGMGVQTGEPSFSSGSSGDRVGIQAYEPRNQQRWARESPRKGSGRRSTKSAYKNEKSQKTDAANPPLQAKRWPSVNTKKKKQGKGRVLSPAVAVDPNSSNAAEGTPAASDDPADLKRAELLESPETRAAFKEFYRKFRAEERSSFQAAENFALQSLADGSLPDKVHWKVYLELADLAKRSNRFTEARRLYGKVCELQPYASQGWLEYSKLEEECGQLKKCSRILQAGLMHCQFSENLLTRAIKHEEKMGSLGRARELLARLKHVGIEKVWRAVLEGALLEARAGNDVMARRVLKYLMHHVPWYGPLYLEAYRLERDLNRTAEALAIVERGLGANPRYGPLWFGAFRLYEVLDLEDGAYDLPRTMAMIDRATTSISKELIWKVHLEAAQMLERSAFVQAEADPSSLDDILGACRERSAMTILTCPANLRWKVWLAAGRMEVATGRANRARSLFLRAHQVVPEKGRAATLLECARLEEFVGDTSLARAILCKSRSEIGSDWKVWLESVLLEVRCQKHSRAIQLAKAALECHSGTGRLWAAFVQLRHYDGGEVAQFSTLKSALNAVPKSGEVWCEGGRMHLNPFAHAFDIERARRHLFFATKFTPQYGDSFLESLRLELLEEWASPIARLVWEANKSDFMKKVKLEEEKCLPEFIFDVAMTVYVINGNHQGISTEIIDAMDDAAVSTLRDAFTKSPRDCYEMRDLELRCANADPNYGLLWFHCRLAPTDTARRVLARAVDKVAAEVKKYAHIYVSAMIRRLAIAEILKDQSISGTREDTLIDNANWEDRLDSKLFAMPSVHTILEQNTKGLEKGIEKTGMNLLESFMTGSEFVTGLAELNKHRPIESMSLLDRRKALFGTDALFS